VHHRPVIEWSLNPDVLHLNHGSYGAVPRRTQELAARLRCEMEANPMAWFRALPGRLAESRQLLAAYLGADPDGFALVPNASAGVTVALAAVPIPAGGRIVLTDHAYGAVLQAAYRFARMHDAEVVTVPVPLEASDDELVEAVSAAVDDRAAVLVIDQISSPTARVFPVAPLVELCRRAGVPVIVDGAHAPGLLDAPVPAGADFWTGNFHKWPCAPRGTAGLAVSESWRDRVRPPIASWAEPAELPSRFDQQGTGDYVPWLAAPASLEVLADLGWQERYRSSLAEPLTEAAGMVAGALGTAVRVPPPPAPTMRLVEMPDSFDRLGEVARYTFSSRVAEELGAEIAVTAFGGRAFLRLSAHAYNTPRDYERRRVEELAHIPLRMATGATGDLLTPTLQGRGDRLPQLLAMDRTARLPIARDVDKPVAEGRGLQICAWRYGGHLEVLPT
jgi:isopenicillin-N epimerase